MNNGFKKIINLILKIFIISVSILGAFRSNHYINNSIGYSGNLFKAVWRFLECKE